jgi:hypothetical protein
MYMIIMRANKINNNAVMIASVLQSFEVATSKKIQVYYHI